MTRRPAAKLGADGCWHAWVTVGRKPNGRPDQRHVKRASREAVEQRVDELIDQRRAGAVQRAGRPPTVRGWLLDVYLTTIAPRKIDPTTVQGYRNKIVNHVVPVIGEMRMDRVTADNIDAVYLGMERRGLADATVLQVHRILARAWKVAARRRVVPRDIMRDDVDPPTARRVEMDPLTEDDARAVLTAAEGRRNAARWSVGLALGLRQGEALGLRWSYVDLDVGEVRVWWQLHRRGFEHGCGPDLGSKCGRRRGGNCPSRYLPTRSGEIVLDGGLLLKAPKGKSKRTIPMPSELVERLAAHREVQRLERQFAGGVVVDHDLVFTELDGRPIDPSTDWEEWRAVLAAAGVPAHRVHDARHTAGTLMLAQGVDIRVVQELMGHSKITTTQGYVHVADAMAREATQRMGASLLRRRETR
ncbi:MAG TPA: site-specific integrase [Pilimelia sp.]|nr:site-specific integrase [Pilimelia sp.]